MDGVNRINELAPYASALREVLENIFTVDSLTMFIASVTGTDGKTSVPSFTRQIWEHAGMRATGLGTLGIGLPIGTCLKPKFDASLRAIPP